MRNNTSIADQLQQMSGPSFKTPPAVERVLSVQFRELAGFELVHYGMWFERIRQEFPHSTRQDRLPPIIEHFPAQPGRGRVFNVEVGVPLGRCVFSSPQPSKRLQQLQPDRFAMNWRRDADEEYLHFPETSRRFAESFEAFQEFCRETDLPQPLVELCEVTYVNRIAIPENVTQADYFSQVFGEAIVGETADRLPAPSGISVNRRFDFPGDQGRLYAQASSAHDASGECLVLKMIGRTVIRKEECWQERMQLAHDWVVKGFVAITRDTIRNEVWGQEHA